MLPGKTYKPDDILLILKKRFWVLVLPFALVSALAAAWAYRLPDIYRSETVILVVPQRVPESYVRSTVTTRIEDRLQSITQQILSRTRLERIIQDFNLYSQARQTGIMEDIVERMRREIQVQVVRGDSFRVSYIGDNPRTVMRVTERLASLFIEENLREREVLAEGTNQFLEAQLEDARRRLVEQEKKVEEYRKRFAGQLPTQLDSNLQVLQGTQAQMAQIAESINRDQDRRLSLERQIADLEQTADAPVPVAAAPGSASGPEQELANARLALAGLQTRLKDTHPDVRRMVTIVRELEKKVAGGPSAGDGDGDPAVAAISPGDAARRKRIADLRTELAQLDRQIAKKQDDEQKLRGQAGNYAARVEAAPTRESEMTELTRDYKTLEQLYNSLLSKKEDSKIAANLERRQIGEQFKLLDPARVPERPFSPDRRSLNAMGMAIGLAIGLLLIAVLEYRDKSFKTDYEVTRLLSLPVLAVVPKMQSAVERKWAFRKQLLLVTGCSVTVAGCLAIVAYTFVKQGW